MTDILLPAVQERLALLVHGIDRCFIGERDWHRLRAAIEEAARTQDLSPVEQIIADIWARAPVVN